MRVFNFSAGPAQLPLPVLEQAASELTSWGGSGMSVLEVSHRGADFVACAAADVEPEAAAEMVSSCCESIMKTCQVGTWAWVNPTGQLSGPPVLSLTTCSVDGVKGLCHPYFWRT